MNDALIDFLSSKQAMILSDWKHRSIQEWSSRLSSNAMSGKMGASRAASSSSIINLQMDEIINKQLLQIFEQLLHSIEEDASGGRSTLKKLLFPHYTPSGKQFSLGLLMDILRVGEDVVMNALVLESLGKHRFTSKEVATQFERVNRGFHELIVFYSRELCLECLKPIDEASESVQSLTDQFQKSGPDYLRSRDLEVKSREETDGFKSNL
jgi:hypothetical protein